MDNQNQNPNQETDILVLLNYFKNGFKNILSVIGDFFKYILNVILWFFILLKRYFVLVLGSIIVFSIIGYFNKDISAPSYNYELVIQPNYNSTKSIYQLINSYDELSELSNQNFFKEVKKISIAPVKSFTNDLSVFYNIITDNKNDTIFAKQYKIEDFRKNIIDTDYPFHIIFIKSTKELSPVEIKNKVLAPIENDPYFTKIKVAYLKSIDIKEKYYKNNLQKIDTLLLALAEGDKSKYAASSLSIKGEAKNNIEEDLLNKSIELTEYLSALELDKPKNSNVINVISEPQLVDNKSSLIKRNTLSFAVYGFIFSLLAIFSIQFIKYLNKFEKEHS